MYEATSDPYCYPGTDVLINLADLRDPAMLEEFEHAAALQRAEEPYPTGRLGLTHYKALHKHLFQDVYPWAGEYRTVRIAKGGSMFCYPEHIAGEMRRLFHDLAGKRYLRDRTAESFATSSAAFLAELNAIHPFREGNGRTQLTYLTLLAEKAGHPLDLDRLDPEAILRATIESFGGSDATLVAEIQRLIASLARPRRVRPRR